MERRKLLKDEIAEGLASLDSWVAEADTVKRRYEFENFAQSLRFVNKVGEIAEEADHHPDIYFGWGYAEIAFTTHDRGGVTDLDLHMAKRTDSLFALGKTGT